MKQILLSIGLAFGIALESSAQIYHSDPLLATNTVVNGAAVSSSTSSNFVASNFASASNPNVPVPGNGIFEIKNPANGVITFQAAYTQITNSALGNLFNVGQQTNFTLLVQPLLDDYTLKNAGNYILTNSSIVSISFPNMTVSSTNGVSLVQASTSVTNFLGCRYGKLVGITGIFTNSLQFQSLRVGYPVSTLPN